MYWTETDVWAWGGPMGVEHSNFFFLFFFLLFTIDICSLLGGEIFVYTISLDWGAKEGLKGAW